MILNMGSEKVYYLEKLSNRIYYCNNHRLRDESLPMLCLYGGTYLPALGPSSGSSG